MTGHFAGDLLTFSVLGRDGHLTLTRFNRNRTTGENRTNRPHIFQLNLEKPELENKPELFNRNRARNSRLNGGKPEPKKTVAFQPEPGPEKTGCPETWCLGIFSKYLETILT